jgi:hypothetical protein
MHYLFHARDKLYPLGARLASITLLTPFLVTMLRQTRMQYNNGAPRPSQDSKFRAADVVKNIFLTSCRVFHELHALLASSSTKRNFRDDDSIKLKWQFIPRDVIPLSPLMDHSRLFSCRNLVTSPGGGNRQNYILLWSRAPSHKK